MHQRWSLDDIPWGEFDPAKVDPEIVRIVKAASLVEANGADYTVYLCNVFADDPDFQAAARIWGNEEVRHGRALARWAVLADPEFDFDAALRRFTEGFRLPLDATRSVRGSRAGELVARCMVEVGTSSYYSALMNATGEPVLKEICRRIALDEVRHYKLFYTHLERYLARDGLGRWRRLRVGLGRVGEAEDDELAYAYYAANAPLGEAYDRRRASAAYLGRALAYYRLPVVRRAVSMTLRALGMRPTGRASDWIAALAYRFVHYRARRLAAFNAA